MKKKNTNYPWLFLIIAFILIASYRGSVLPILATELDSFFRVGSAAIGLLLSAGPIGQLITNTVAGPLLDVLGPRKLLSYAYLGIVVTLTLAALSGNFILFLLSITGIGMCAAAANISVPLYIIRLFPHWKRKSFTLNMVSGLLPGLFFPVLIEQLMLRYPDHFDEVLHIPFLCLAAIGIVLYFLFVLRSPRFPPQQDADPGPERRGFFSGYTEILRKPRFLIFPLLLFLHASADSLFFNWMPEYLRSTFSQLPIGSGTVLMFFSLSYFMSRILLISIPDHVGRRLFLILPGLIGGGILIIGIISKNAIISSLFYPIGAFFWSFEAPSLLAEGYRHFSRNFGTFQGLILIASGTGAILMNSLTGLLVDAGIPLKVILLTVACFFLVFSLISSLSSLGKK